MTQTIAICNQKGGVGKTTTTLNLGVGLVRQDLLSYVNEFLQKEKSPEESMNWLMNFS